MIRYWKPIAGIVVLSTVLGFAYGALQARASASSPGVGGGAAAVNSAGPVRGLQASDEVGDPVFLPSLSFQGLDDVCRSWVSVQNIGSRPTKAILLTWPEWGDCPPDCSGPQGAECSGLLAPGGAWNFLGAQVPVGSASGMVFSANAGLVSEIAPEWSDPKDIVADALCQRLAAELVGNCDAASSFLSAYDEGGDYWGIPLSETRGSPLAVHVIRHCPGDYTPGVEVSSTYVGLTGAALGTQDPQTQRYEYVAPMVRGGRDFEFASIAVIQNASPECQTVAVTFQARDACEKTVECEDVTIAPGESAPVDFTVCLSEIEGAAIGSALFSADGPLAVTIDTIGYNTFTTYAAVSALSGLPADPVLANGGSSALYGPVLYYQSGVGRSRVHVQNLEPDLAADVGIEFYRADGTEVSTDRTEICAGGSHTFELPPGGSRPGRMVGLVRVASQRRASDPAGPAPRLAGTGEYVWYADATLEEALEAGATLLLPEPLSYCDNSTPGVSSGTTVLALPVTPTDLDATGCNSELLVTNLTSHEGKTTAALRFYDQNGLVREDCLELQERETKLIDLYTLPNVTIGYIGSAVISAVYWDHSSGDSDGFVGLAASQIVRTGTRPDTDVPGDEMAVSFVRPIAPGTAGNFGGVSKCAPPPQPPPSPTPVMPTSTPDKGDAARALWTHVNVPILNYEGQGDVCRAYVEVQNTGAESSKVIFAQFGAPGFCPPQCAGPLRLQCSGLLAQGGTWDFELSRQETAKSGVLYSVSARTMSELGAVPGSDEPVADVLCDALATAMPGDCNVFRQFQLAYDEGLEYAGIPLDKAYGGPLAATVERVCPGDLNPGTEVRASYEGIAYGEMLAPFPKPWRHTYAAKRVLARHDGYASVLYLQNAGLECTDIVLAFREHGASHAERQCNVFSLSPGEVYQFNAQDCVGPEFVGSASIASDEPLAIVVDQIGNDELLTYRATAGANPFDLNYDGLVDGRDARILARARGSRPGDENWDPRADLNLDSFVDEADLAIMVDHYTEGEPAPTPWATATPKIRPPEGTIHLPYCITP